MRLRFPNEVRLKSASKVIATEACVSLARAQEAVARISGYNDWFDLQNCLTEYEQSPLDDVLTPAEFIERQVQLAEKLASELNLAGGDALYTLGISRLTGNRLPKIDEQTAARIRLFTSNELPVAGKREKGAIGKLRTAGRTGEPVILRQFGKPSRVITHKSADASVADFEYLTPKAPHELFIPMRLYLAYGMWIEPDGAIVLFSRDYFPLWRIRNGQRPQRMDPWARIQYTKQQWFWGDENTPWRNQTRFLEEIARLRQFGVEYLPRLVEALPLLILRDDIRDFQDTALALRGLYESPEAA